jgi:hypothetical protein
VQQPSSLFVRGKRQQARPLRGLKSREEVVVVGSGPESARATVRVSELVGVSVHGPLREFGEVDCEHVLERCLQTSKG